MAKLGPSKWTRPERLFKMIMTRNRIKHTCHPKWGDKWTADFLVRGVIVDVHGFHWHHSSSNMKRMSKYWRDKIMANRERDRRKMKFAAANGIAYAIFWDFELVGRDRITESAIINYLRYVRRRVPKRASS